MKAGWQVKKLSEVCDIVNGSTPLRSKKEFWENGTIEWFTIEDIREQGRKIKHTKQKVTETALKETSLRILPINSVLLCCTASIGEHAIAEIPLATNQQFNGLVVKDKTSLNPYFLFHFCATLKDVLSNLSGKTTIDFIPISRLKEIAIPLPPIQEQQHIVAILDQAFEGIAKARANAEQNLQNARALFKSHLQSVFTQRGDGWVTKTVGELVTDGVLNKPFDGNHGEIHPRKSDFTETGIPFVMASDLVNGLVDTENCNHIPKKLADSLRVGFARNDDVLISHKGTIGRSAIVSTTNEYIMLTPQVTAYRVKNKESLLNKFIRYYFMSPIFQNEIISAAQDGSTRAYVGITRQSSLKFRFPSLSEQHSIVEILEQMLPESQRLEALYQRKIACLDELKKSLLQQAFAGEL